MIEYAYEYFKALHLNYRAQISIKTHFTDSIKNDDDILYPFLTIL